MKMNEKIEKMFDGCMKKEDSDQEYEQNIIDRIDGTIDMNAVSQFKDAIIEMIQGIDEVYEYDPSEISAYIKKIVDKQVYKMLKQNTR